MNIIPNLNIRVMRSNPVSPVSPSIGSISEKVDKVRITPAQKKAAIDIIYSWDGLRTVQNLKQDIVNNFETTKNFEDEFKADKNFNHPKEVKLKFAAMLKEQCLLDEHQDLTNAITAFEKKIQQQETPATTNLKTYPIEQGDLNSNTSLKTETTQYEKLGLLYKNNPNNDEKTPL